MKNLLVVALVALASALSAKAQHLSQSFLVQRSIHVTNTIPITNLVSFPGMTNILGTVYTNGAGTRLEVTNAGNTVNLLRDVSLWADRNGVPFARSDTNRYDGPATLFIKLQGGSGANAAVTFVFTPIWDGATPPLVTGDDWSVAVTAVASAQTTLATNAPFYRWPGAKNLRLKSIVNADTDASSGVFVNQCSLNGFVP